MLEFLRTYVARMYGRKSASKSRNFNFKQHASSLFICEFVSVLYERQLNNMNSIVSNISNQFTKIKYVLYIRHKFLNIK